MSCSIVWQTSNKLLPPFAADQYKYFFSLQKYCALIYSFEIQWISSDAVRMYHILYWSWSSSLTHWNWRFAISLPPSVLHFNQREWCKIVYRAKLYIVQNYAKCNIHNFALYHLPHVVWFHSAHTYPVLPTYQDERTYRACSFGGGGSKYKLWENPGRISTLRSFIKSWIFQCHPTAVNVTSL